MLLLHTTKLSYLKVRKIKTVKQYLYEFFEIHKDKLTENYPGLSKDILVKKYLDFHNLKSHIQATDVFLNPNDTFFVKALEGIPFEYLLGEKFFFNHNFIVNSDVLIPRNETEILVEDTINWINKHYHDDFKMLEVGVGSGCIFLSILCELDQKIHCHATDISEKALAVSKSNKFRLERLINRDSSLTLQCTDRLYHVEGEFDLIVSNPPYIKKDQGLNGVHWQVNRYEPHLALYLDDSEHDQWFLTFFTQIYQSLKLGGIFIMEGHEDTLESLSQMAKTMFSSITIKNDYTGSKRFLHLIK